LDVDEFKFSRDSFDAMRRQDNDGSCKTVNFTKPSIPAPYRDNDNLRDIWYGIGKIVFDTAGNVGTGCSECPDGPGCDEWYQVECTNQIHNFTDPDSKLLEEPFRVPVYERYRIQAPFEHVLIDSSQNNLYKWDANVDNKIPIQLSAWWFPSSRYDIDKRSVILLHGLTSMKGSSTMLVLASMLLKKGLSVMMFDFRNHGNSTIGNEYFSAGYDEAVDLSYVIKWLFDNKNIQPHNLGLMGVSLGCFTMMNYFTADYNSIIQMRPWDSIGAAQFRNFGLFAEGFRDLLESELVYQNFPATLVKSMGEDTRIFGETFLDIELFRALDDEGIDPTRSPFDKNNTKPYLWVYNLNDTRVQGTNRSAIDPAIVEPYFANRVNAKTVSYDCDHADEMWLFTDSVQEEVSTHFLTYLTP
tara:strand:- start:1142 stop:2380 length:1239 start_codon:yes stop_codon:yes gene_type:complete